MDFNPVFKDLKTSFPDLEIYNHYSLKPYTTLKIGGPADILVITTKQSQIFSLLKYLHLHQNLPYYFLGLGSNVLISDTGLRGLTIINRANKIQIMPKITPSLKTFKVTDTQRRENEPEKYLDFSKIDYDESASPTQDVVINTGTPLPYAINYLISQGLTGLQWFAYIPGTLGGAVYQNIHGGRYHLSDYLVSLKVFNLKTGKTMVLKLTNEPNNFSEHSERYTQYSPKVASTAKIDSANQKINFRYETSPFQSHPHLIVLSVRLRLFRGNADLAKQVVSAWITQKSKVQPMNSAGSTFQNPSPEICQKIWGEQKSTGWIIDHELNLKGHQIGGAQISPLHANFIVNTGTATAADYAALVKFIQDKCFSKFKFKLLPEVKFLGEF